MVMIVMMVMMMVMTMGERQLRALMRRTAAA
jgi:hypothetical protein